MFKDSAGPRVRASTDPSNGCLCQAPGTGWEGRVSWEHMGFLAVSPMCSGQGAVRRVMFVM